LNSKPYVAPLVNPKDKDILRHFLSIIRGVNCTDRETLARHGILNKISYRLPNAASRDPFIGFRELKRTWFSKKAKQTILESKRFIFDSGVKTVKLRTEYLTGIGFEQCAFIPREELISFRSTISWSVRFTIGFYGLIWAIKCLTASNRSNIAQLHRSFIELAVLARQLQANFPIEVFDFNQFEADSNVFYLVLKEAMSDQLTYYKFPSPGPLYLHNSVLFTDTLCYNSPYHLEEIEHYSSSMSYDKLLRVPAEQFFSYEACYLGGEMDSKPAFALCYYSHASWLRKHRGDKDNGLGILDYENTLLTMIAAYLKDNEAVRLKVFTHPKERKGDYLPLSNAYYNQFFHDSDRVSYVEPDGSSARLFHEAHVGLGVYSTILFERLACGFPTLFMTPTKQFPLETSVINNLVVNESNLVSKIDHALAAERAIFYKEHEIESYLEPSLSSSR
jgi:hypothetical protein